MTRVWPLLIAVLLAAPASAQEEAPAEEEAEVVPAEESDAGETTTEEAATEEAATDDAAADETADATEETDEPWQLYAGVDYVLNTLSTSGSETELDTGMYRLRLGKRAFESVGVELHYGLDNSDGGPTDVETESYYGLFVVPTATLFETLELAFPIGYAKTSLGGGGASADLGSIGYGVDLELPLRAFGETLPDVRFTAGGMVYYQKSDARLYGVNAGLRYDFTTASLGNPFGWVADIDLWPFGDDDAAEPAD